MTIINPFKCPECDMELQPEDILVGTDANNNLIRKCGFCGDEIII